MYIVEGNIGAGKSTFLKVMAKQLPQIEVILEPVAQWQHTQGESLLTNFYVDTHRWAFTMETWTMACRVREHLYEQQNQNPFRLLERSIYSGHYCFALNDYESGFLTSLEWHAYLQWFNFLVLNKCRPPLGFIYLYTSPEISYERIAKRSRDGESTIPLEYLQRIDQKHAKFLIEKENVLPELQTVPVLILDCNQEFESNPQRAHELAQQVHQFMLDTAINQPIQDGKYDAYQL